MFVSLNFGSIILLQVIEPELLKKGFELVNRYLLLLHMDNVSILSFLKQLIPDMNSWRPYNSQNPEPLCYKFIEYVLIYREGLEVTDDVSIVEHLKHPVFITEGSYTNIKVSQCQTFFLHILYSKPLSKFACAEIFICLMHEPWYFSVWQVTTPDDLLLAERIIGMNEEWNHWLNPIILFMLKNYVFICPVTHMIREGHSVLEWFTQWCDDLISVGLMLEAYNCSTAFSLNERWKGWEKRPCKIFE